MSRPRRNAFRRVAEQATDWLTRPPSPVNDQRCLRWLLESPLHVREATLAMAWEDEIRQCLDPEHRLDVESFIDQARDARSR